MDPFATAALLAIAQLATAYMAIQPTPEQDTPTAASASYPATIPTASAFHRITKPFWMTT